MKVLFLDIDGVLCTYQTWFLHGSLFINSPDVGNKLDVFGVKFIEQLAKSGVKIVLSSTWRLGSSLEELNSIFTFPIYGKTDYLCREIRGVEIQKWIDEHPEVENYVIVDDDSDMLPEQMTNFVLTSYDEGITFKKANEIVEKLFGKSAFDFRVQKEEE